MRILSQDGRIDIPYEMVGINIWGKEDPKRKAFCVYAHSNSLSMREGVMALYSSQEKAQKAMEMLRNAFSNYDWIKTTGNSDELKKVASMLTHEQFSNMTSSYFQFPSDDEIEV